uniref:PWWP domain-containing protein n=1 Tax=Anopheles minimus TaxID=112268 RepID=A0A340TBH9_9DIPT
MSGNWQLQTPCEVINAIWSNICAIPSCEIEHPRLVKELYKTLQLDNQELAEQHIKTAQEDRLLAMVVRAKKRGRAKSNTIYTIPKLQTVSDEQPDKCCYECHNTGNVVKCVGCMRSFHEDCVKPPEEKQRELGQFVSKEKQIIISAFENQPTRPVATPMRRNSIASITTMDESTVWANEFQPDEDDAVEIVEDEIFEIEIKHENMGLDSSYQSIKVETDVKEGLLVDEPMFVGMVRPPNRRLERMLNTTTIKPEGESSDSDDNVARAEENDMLRRRYCYACHVLNNSPSNPNIGTEELNYLLNFVIEQYKSWLPKDTFSPSKLVRGKAPKTVLTSKVIEICKKMLLRTPTSMASIQSKITNKQYNSLEEFHVDLLDIVHNIGIIHGGDSFDYSAAMYLLADCVYELREIRQCSDCYRHSAEKVEPDWFTRPCRTRHEVVFAKQRSFQYWPAKVVRVTNDRYDVRFFGDKHMRALINANYVKPIDTELSTLGVNAKQRGFKQAMTEMLQYRSLSEGYRDQYSFTSAIEQTPRTQQPSLPQTPCDVVGGERVSNGGNTSRPVTRKRNIQTQQPAVTHQQKHRKFLDRFTNPVELRAKALQLLQEGEEQFSRKLDLLKVEHQREISDVKKKQWCAMCEKEARIQCCWNTSYCTTDCQKNHWVQHQKRHQAGNRYHRLRSVSVFLATQQGN